MVPAAIPQSLPVVGSGAIGIEFASFYHDMGAEVTVVEVLDRVLPVEDEEISAFARKSFEKQGIRIHTGATVAALERSGENVVARIDGGGRGASSLSSASSSPSALSATSKASGSKTPVSRSNGATSSSMNGFAPASPASTRSATSSARRGWRTRRCTKGVICVERIAGVNDVHPLDLHNIPSCTYCRPQVASVGLTEKAAREAGHEVKIGHFPFIGNGKAIALGEPEGMIKTVFDGKTGELLGAHMIGAEVTELIQGYTIAKTLETTETELIRTIFPHPTLSETMHEAVLDAYGQTIHF